MITQLTIDEIIELVKSKPEQAIFDWKNDFTIPNDNDKRGEIIKDIAALANAACNSYGFIVYGVNPQHPKIIKGITTSYDDANLQQLVKGKIDPEPNFLYYEVSFGPKKVGVIQVKPSKKRPFIITTDIGKVRQGQIVIRKGSATVGATLNDLLYFFYGQTSGYFPQVVQKLQLNVAEQNATTAYLRELREGANDAVRDMEITAGLPPGSLGGKY